MMYSQRRIGIDDLADDFAKHDTAIYLLPIRYFYLLIASYFLGAMNLVHAQPLFFYEQIPLIKKYPSFSSSHINKKDLIQSVFEFSARHQYFFYLTPPNIEKLYMNFSEREHRNVLPDYEVIIKAPYKLSKLLKANLEIIRHSKSNQIISSAQFDYLLAKTARHIEDLLQTEGYFSPKVYISDKHSISNQTKGKFLKNQKKRIVIVKVEPGEQSTVDRVMLRFSGDINMEAKDRIHVIQNAFALRKGDPFSQEAWDAAKADALLELQSERYLGAYIDFSEALVHKENGTVDLRVDFFSGPTFYLGPITFSGIQRYPKFIVDYINPLREGEIYFRARINELQRKVQNSSYYSGVGIDIQNDMAHAQCSSVKASLREFPFYSMRSGVGYSTDRGAHLQGAFSFNNLFGKSWIFTTQGRYEKKNRFGSVAFVMPPGYKGYVNSMLASYNTSNLASSPMTSVRLGFSRERSLQFYDYTYSLLFYRDLVNRQSLAPQNSFALMPNFKFAYRNINDLIYPSRGYLFNVEVGIALKDFFSKANFFRLHCQGKRYFSPSERSVILMRGELGAIFSATPASDIPASLRFRTGGALSVRGYQFEGIGAYTTGGVVPTKYMLNTSAEYQYWYLKDWGTAFFLDLGMATNSVKKARSYPGYGIGIRWNSPVGPVNMDLGFGLLSGLPRLHFALGIAL